jgi:hypothetical protein
MYQRVLLYCIRHFLILLFKTENSFLISNTWLPYGMFRLHSLSISTLYALFRPAAVEHIRPRQTTVYRIGLATRITSETTQHPTQVIIRSVIWGIHAPVEISRDPSLVRETVFGNPWCRIILRQHQTRSFIPFGLLLWFLNKNIRSEVMLPSPWLEDM